MGAEGSKSKPSKSSSSKNSKELSDKDYAFLSSQTRLSKEEIKDIFDSFSPKNPLGLDRQEFVKLYCDLRPESASFLQPISNHAFRCFDKDHNGFISFGEFLISYAITTKGDLNQKLEYAFDLYDQDGNGLLDVNEIRNILYGMLDLLGADQKMHNVPALATQCLKDLDTRKDGQVSKSEFIEGLASNYSLRALMSPFC